MKLSDERKLFLTQFVLTQMAAMMILGGIYTPDLMSFCGLSNGSRLSPSLMACVSVTDTQIMLVRKDSKKPFRGEIQSRCVATRGKLRKTICHPEAIKFHEIYA